MKSFFSAKWLLKSFSVTSCHNYTPFPNCLVSEKHFIHLLSLTRSQPQRKRKTLRGTHTQCKIWDGLTCHDIHINFHENWFRNSNLIWGIHTDTPSNIKVLSQKFDRLQCQYYWWKEFMMYAIEMASCGMIYLPSFVNIGTGVQAILRFCLKFERL
jgi:hypothetical protein